MTENAKKWTMSEAKERIEKMQWEILTSPPEKTSSLLRAFTSFLGREKYLTQEFATDLLRAGQSAGMPEIEAIQVIRDAAGLSEKKTETVTIDRNVYDILVAAYKSHEAAKHATWVWSNVPMLTPSELETLDQA